MVMEAEITLSLRAAGPHGKTLKNKNDSTQVIRTDYTNGEMQLVCAKALQLTVDIVGSCLLWYPGRSQLPERKRVSRCLEQYA